MNPPEMPIRVLSIEDEGTVRRSIVAYLEDSGFEMLEAVNGRIGLQVFQDERPDLVLCDLRMPEVDGLTVLAQITAIEPEVPIIIVSGTGDMGDAIEALKLGAWDYITKPIQDMAVLEHAIRKALERATLIREVREYREHLETTNKALQDSLRQLEEDENAARRIQFQLLPDTPAVFHGYAFSHFIKTSALLSGDFVDYFQIDESHLGFYIADVSGHGVSSAFVTVLLKSTMNHLLEQYRLSENDAILYPGRVLKLINDDIVGQDFGKYLTIFYIVVHLHDNTACFANGGQFPCPILCDGASSRTIGERNLPVGLFEEAVFPETRMPLPDTFNLVMFSDGVLEIMPEQRLRDKQLSIQNMVNCQGVTLESLVEGMGLHSPEAPLDDVTIMLVRKG